MAATSADVDQDKMLNLTTDIVSAYVSNNSISAEKLPNLLLEVHNVIRTLAAGGIASAGNQEPAAPIKKSITADFLICLEDGKKLKMLKRYLRTQYGLSPEDYRRKWGLPADYPMTAPNYAKRRSDFAKEFGLGRIARSGARSGPKSAKTTTKATTKKKAAKRHGRPRKTP